MKAGAAGTEPGGGRRGIGGAELKHRARRATCGPWQLPAVARPGG